MTIDIGPKWPGLVIMGWMLSVFCPGWNAPDDVWERYDANRDRLAAFTELQEAELREQALDRQDMRTAEAEARGYLTGVPPMVSLPPAWPGGIVA